MLKNIMTKSSIKENKNTRKKSLDEIAGHYGMRILFDLNCMRKISSFSFSYDSDLLSALGVCELENSDIPIEDFTKILKDKKKKNDKKPPPKIHGTLKRNIKQLSGLVGLSKCEIKILSFVLVLNNNRGLSDIADLLGTLNGIDTAECLSIILKIPYKKIQKALNTKSLLSSSGILRIAKKQNNYLARKFILMNQLDSLMFEDNNNTELIDSFFIPVEKSTLSSDDYHHISEDFNLLVNYLTKVSAQREMGVNILVHGKPGTGKSELAKVLAETLEFKIYGISIADSDGEAIKGKDRFTSYQLCQKILARQNDTLIVFDEIEDVFPDNTQFIFNDDDDSDRRKAWINRLLEVNPIPAIWISNKIHQIDRAYIRRFDYVLNLELPPKNVRAEILNKHFKDLTVSNEWINKVAENSNIAPALVSRAARVALNVDDDNSCSKKTEKNLERILGNTLSAMGYSNKLCTKRNQSVSYRLDALNPDTNVHTLVEGLKKNPEGCFLFFGPSGSGKTHYGRHIASSLNKPLIIKRASDLLHPYVGMSEKNIAEAFAQANKEDGILQIDEADSFLQERRGASKSWEVTLVNEMLTQMEAFEGVFICTTNLMDGLDAASLRRFHLKIHFDFLKIEQSWILFQQTLEDYNCPLSDNTNWKKNLAKLTNLTPGDFSNVIRQSKISAESLTASILFEGLSKESKFKDSRQSYGIGFTAVI